MHIVVLIGFIIFLGGLDLIRGLIQGNIFVNLWASSSKFMMMISGLLFIILCTYVCIPGKINYAY